MSIPDPVVLLDARARYVHPAFQMSRASTKTVFDATGKLVTVPANAIGWDHDPATGQARGYLAEPSATNLLRQSNDLTAPVWNLGNMSVSAAAITGPDGQGMAKVVEDSSAGIHLVRQNYTIAAGADITASFIAKAGERARIRLYMMNANSVTQNFRLDVSLADGTVFNQNESSSGTLIDSGSVDLGGGFYRVWIAGNIGAGITDARIEARFHDGNSDSYQGDGTSGLYLGYFQVEEGKFPTSYIETGAATATRAADSLVLSGLDEFPWWRSERGTAVLDVRLPGAAVGDALFGLDQQVLLRLQTTGVNLAGSVVNSTRLLSFQNTPSRHVIAVSWDNDNGFGASVDGGNVISGDLQGDVTATSIGLGNRGLSGGASTALCHIHRAVYYPQRPSNADLQSLTAIQE